MAVCYRSQRSSFICTLEKKLKTPITKSRVKREFHARICERLGVKASGLLDRNPFNPNILQEDEEAGFREGSFAWGMLSSSWLYGTR